jgi:hypothetical protein
MKLCESLFSVSVLVACALLGGCASSGVQAQPNPEPSSPSTAMIESAPTEAAMATPSPQHLGLKAMIGTWDAKVTAAGETETSNAVAVYRAIGDLWIASDYRGEMMGKPFIGHGIDGFDTLKQKFVSAWVDSLTSEVLLLEGTHDDATHTTTMTGSSHDPESGMLVTWKTSTVMTSPDSMTFTMGMLMPDGTASEVMRIEYQRRK